MTDRRRPEVLHHFSEDPGIDVFEPHVPATNPTHPPAVWAIDPDHAPLYWFPRNCPRATAWPRSEAERSEFERALATTAPRVHAIEASWFGSMRSTRLYRYGFDPVDFRPWAAASGQWTSDQIVRPTAVEPCGDLVDLHAAAGIELRLVPALRPVAALLADPRWDFSIVRLANARR